MMLSIGEKPPDLAVWKRSSWQAAVQQTVPAFRNPQAPVLKLRVGTVPYGCE